MVHRRQCSFRIAPRTLAALAALLLVSGCTTGFVYNRLDRVAYWYFSRQVTLSDAQSSDLKTELTQLLQWHRRSELPRYSALLEELARDAARPLGRRRIDAIRLEVEELWRDVLRQVAPRAAGWLADLTDEQIDELLANLAQDDEELREKYCEPDERTLARRRERSLASAIEEWTGRLTREQRSLVRAAVADLDATGCEWVANQKIFRQELRRLLVTRTRDREFSDALTQLLLTPEERWTDTYRERFVANRERVITLLAEIDVTLSPRQRARLVRRFDRLAQDLRDLARSRRTAHGELGDEHDVFGRLHRSRVPHVPGERVSADPL